jgi:hypothetical protein
MGQTAATVAHNALRATSESAWDTRHRMAAAVELRKQGYSMQSIADTLGCSRSYAEKLIKKAFNNIIEKPTKELLEMELQRLDALLVPAFAAATATDPETGTPIFNKDAIDSVLKIMERRAKFCGLDKPVKTKVEATVSTNPTVSIYLPDNGRGDAPVTIDNESQQIEHPAIEIIRQGIMELDEGDPEPDLSDLGDPMYDEEDEQYL